MHYIGEKQRHEKKESCIIEITPKNIPLCEYITHILALQK
jgi:hypothetical protein